MAREGLLIDYEYCTGCHTCEIACQMEHGFPVGVLGISVAEIGPFEYGDGKWQWAYNPVPTDLCDLCAERVALGKKPTCVHHCQANVMKYGPVSELAKELESKPKLVLYTVR